MQQRIEGKLEVFLELVTSNIGCQEMQASFSGDMRTHDIHENAVAVVLGLIFLGGGGLHFGGSPFRKGESNIESASYHTLQHINIDI